MTGELNRSALFGQLKPANERRETLAGVLLHKAGFGDALRESLQCQRPLDRGGEEAGRRLTRSRRRLRLWSPRYRGRGPSRDVIRKSEVSILPPTIPDGERRRRVRIQRLDGRGDAGAVARRSALGGRDLADLFQGESGQESAGRDQGSGVRGQENGEVTTPTAAVPEPAAPVAPQPEKPKAETKVATKSEAGPEATVLRGPAAVVVERMEASREIPTATSVRTIPAKLLEVNRLIINNQLKRLTQGGKVSFTHLIGWAIVRAFKELPDLNVAFAEIDGKPHVVRIPHINLGLAIDLERKDGSRGLVVPNIKEADTLDFKQFWVNTKSWSTRLEPTDSPPTTSPGPRPPSPTPGRSAPCRACPG